MYCPGFNYSQITKMRDYGSHPMIAKTSGVDWRRYECMAQSIHLKERGKTGFITIVIPVGTLSYGRACLRLHADDAHGFT
jgi:hypothetical protein